MHLIAAKNTCKIVFSRHVAFVFLMRWIVSLVRHNPRVLLKFRAMSVMPFRGAPAINGSATATAKTTVAGEI